MDLESVMTTRRTCCKLLGFLTISYGMNSSTSCSHLVILLHQINKKLKPKRKQNNFQETCFILMGRLCLLAASCSWLLIRPCQSIYPLEELEVGNPRPRPKREGKCCRLWSVFCESWFAHHRVCTRGSSTCTSPVKNREIVMWVSHDSFMKHHSQCSKSTHTCQRRFAKGFAKGLYICDQSGPFANESS